MAWLHIAVINLENSCAFTVQLYIDGSKSSSSLPCGVNLICIFFVFGVSLGSWALGLLKVLFLSFSHNFVSCNL